MRQQAWHSGRQDSTIHTREIEVPVQVPGLLLTSTHTYEYQTRNHTLRSALIAKIIWQTVLH